MFEGRSVSVLITTYRRHATLDRIAAAWLAQPIEELWILDGAGRFQSAIADPRLVVWRLPVDTGTKTDYAMALLTNGDLVVLADDDLVPQAGFLEDLAGGLLSFGGFAGVIGRTFHGPRYHGDTLFYASNEITRPVRVGFVGVVIALLRESLGFDVRGLPRNCDDLWLQMKVHPTLPKHVIPTTRYINLPEASGAEAMYMRPELQAQRQEFYREHYLRHYAPAGLTY